MVEPGSIRTEWGAIVSEHLMAVSGSGAYAAQAAAVAAALKSSSKPKARRTSPSSVIARTVARAATARRPKSRYRVDFGARQMIFLSRVLPDRP